MTDSPASADVPDVPEAELSLVAVVVPDYDAGIAFFTAIPGMGLREDSPSTTNDGRPKRWVVVGPDGGGTGLLLAQADGGDQEAVIGRQVGGRVGFFLRVRDFDTALSALKVAGATIHREPRDEPYGRVVVFEDPWGNRWDLLGPI